jgi:xanthine/uracil permease
VKKVLLFGFLCGAASVLLFHQGLVYVLFHQFPLIKSVTGAVDSFRPQGPGFNFRPNAFGVPQMASTVFWGGLWGILLAALIRWARLPDLLTGFILGGVVATVVGFTLVAQLRGVPLWAGGNSITWARVVLINGAWGWGAALLMRPFEVRRHTG